MNSSDYLGLVILSIFGIWWIMFPQSVIRLYTRIHCGQIKLPSTSGIRAAGALWVVVVIVVFLVVFRRRQ